MKRLWKIITIICAVSAVGGVIASIIDLIQRRNIEKESRTKRIYYHKTKGIYERYLKRFFDFFLSCIALIALSPLMIVTAILVRIKLGSPVLFVQKRPGKDEKIFSIYKFRTMTSERDIEGILLPDEVRLTPFGKLLRSTSIDEIPELVNIMKGDMSFVGPRPQLVRDMVFMTEYQRKRHTVRGGLTGLAQVKGRNIISWEEKLNWDLRYIEKVSFLNDLKIMIHTIGVVFNKKGVTDGVNATALDYGETLLKEGKIDEKTHKELLAYADKLIEKLP